MELRSISEIIPPHFSIPILSVIFLLGLVFAFGFKSSSQPPSFDFGDEKHERQLSGKKQKKRKKKLQEKGKQSMSTTVVKEVEFPGVTDTKTKKSTRTKKQLKNTSEPPKQPANVSKDIVDSGNGSEWSTVTSRKDKKTKQTAPDLQATPQHTVEQTVLVKKRDSTPVVSKTAATADKASKQKKGKKKTIEDEENNSKKKKVPTATLR